MTSPGTAVPGVRHGPSDSLPVASSACAPTSACPRSPRRCRRAPASRSRRCLCCSPHSTRSSAAASACCSPTTRTPATPPRLQAGSSERTVSGFCRHAVSARARASSRRRISSASERAHSTCSPAAGSSAPPRSPYREGMPPPSERPVPLELARGDEPGIEALAEQLALAGYERVERVEERGQIAVRGGLVDVFPSTGREPLRIELFGDKIESIRAFSPFTQRALREAERRRPSTRQPSGGSTPARSGSRTKGTSEIPADLVLPLPRTPISSGSPTRSARSGPRRGFPRSTLDGAAELDPLPQGQMFSFEAQRPALVARGISEAENELQGLLHQGLDVIVTFPHRGEAERRRGLLRRVEPSMLGQAKGRPVSSSPYRRRAAASSGASSASRSCPTRRSSAAARRGPPPRPAVRSRASPTCAPATTSCTRTRDREAPRLRDEGGRRRHARLPAAGFRGEDRVYVPHEQIGKVSRYIGSTAGSDAVQARRQGQQYVGCQR